MAREHVSIRFGPDERQLVDALAARLGLSRSAVVRLAVRSFDERLRATNGDGLEAVIAESAPNTERAAVA